MDNMNQEEKVEKATKYYGNRFKELETNVDLSHFNLNRKVNRYKV